MKPLRISLRAVFYKEDSLWIAHCLEFDLMGHGKTKPEAIKMMTKAIAIQLEMSIKHNNPKNLFSPADGKFFAMFAAGKNVAVGKLKLISTEKVTMEDVEAREYSDEDAELAFS